jgi:hypothetical protein
MLHRRVVDQIAGDLAELARQPNGLGKADIADRGLAAATSPTPAARRRFATMGADHAA